MGEQAILAIDVAGQITAVYFLPTDDPSDARQCLRALLLNAPSLGPGAEQRLVRLLPQP